ncbi:hypothetical protein POM88_051885 [Heracleum sosnowskyi]|uniref:Peptidase A1 domain-containing protein n=1 Tax=Heracleum sosnowskyi TaxID=360622 RepID=A0AAD8LWS5_9APIA|nr:hypothetical protein POM88_051885 [Heracleum sosnowskyi]
MDTGSHLTWVIGDSFKREFMYPPRRSSTQSNITCWSDACKKLGYCNSTGRNCIYQTRYGDGQHKLESYLTYDRFVFQNASVDKVIMGIFCNGKGSLLGEENFYGILGLSPPFHPYARLTLGEKADIRGKTTPLRIDGAHYRISLESISLGRKKLDIDPKLFAQKGIEGGASLLLDEDDLFIDSVLNYFCMTVMPSSTHGPTLKKLTIIGLTAQQDYIMGYDLENQQLAMKLSDI